MAQKAEKILLSTLYIPCFSSFNLISKQSNNIKARFWKATIGKKRERAGPSFAIFDISIFLSQNPRSQNECLSCYSVNNSGYHKNEKEEKKYRVNSGLQS